MMAQPTNNGPRRRLLSRLLLPLLLLPLVLAVARAFIVPGAGCVGPAIQQQQMLQQPQSSPATVYAAAATTTTRSRPRRRDLRIGACSSIFIYI